MTIDLSKLPPPDIIETLDFEQILAGRKAAMLGHFPEAERADLATLLELDSEPMAKLLQESAYRELVLRQRINDAARACMLAYAGGADLDHLAAVFDVDRLLLDAGDPATRPPVPAVWEDDASLRRRAQLAPESYTSCGTFEAYRFHALSVPGVAEAGVIRPEPGHVRVLLLADTEDARPAPGLLQAVQDYLGARDRRSVNDQVEVVAASIKAYSVQATLIVRAGPSSAAVGAAAEAAVRAYAAENRKLGYDITRSGLYAALHQAGVKKAVIARPAADITCDQTEAAVLAAVTLQVEVTDDD